MCRLSPRLLGTSREPMHPYSKIAMEESRMREMKQHMQWRQEVETLQRQQQQLESVSALRRTRRNNHHVCPT